MEIALLIGILVFVLLSFALEWLPIDVTALVGLGLLLLFGLVTPDEAIAGFSNPAVVIVMMLFILSEGLVQSGLIRQLGHAIARMGGGSSRRTTAVALFTAGVLSAFLNNTAVVAIFVPLVRTLGKRGLLSVSRTLLPLSYASILGGTCTLIGTSTNILVSSLAASHGLEPFAMFEFLKLGGILFVVGMVYNLLVVMRALPERPAPASLTEKYRISSYLTEVHVGARSGLVDMSVAQARVRETHQVDVLEILRGERRIAQNLYATPIQVDDILIVRGAMEDIVAFKNQHRLDLLSDVKLDDADLADEENILAEVQLAPSSDLAGATLKEVDFRKKYGCFVLAIDRTQETIREKIGRVRLRSWDVLLVFGPRRRVDGLLSGPSDFLPINELPIQLNRPKRWWLGALAIPVVVILAAAGVAPLVKGVILAVVALLVTGALRVHQAYKAIDWTVIFLLVAILPLGTAIERTGVATWVGEMASGLGDAGGPVAVLGLVILVTSVLTTFVTNNSAAVIMTPVALSVAAGLGVSPKPLLMGLCFAASMSFATPTGYQTNSMVYGPGGYRYMDYVRVGTPLNVAFLILSMLLIPLIWPF